MTGAERVSVIGLGRLGLGFAACLTKAGFDVLGVDLDLGVVDRVNSRAENFDEPGVAEAIAATTAGKLRAEKEISAAAAHGSTAFVLLPTPNLPDGSFDSSTLTQAITDLCVSIHLQSKSRYLIVIGSTVSPGTMSGTIIPLVERILGQPVGDAVAVCYNPEFVALGSVVTGFERPDLILIGKSHTDAGTEVERILRRVVRNNPPVHRMSFVSAEIAKLALNNFLTVKISFANLLSQICSRIDGANIDAITSTLGDDSRIGSKYLRAGPPFGGPCFPLDVRALASLTQQCGWSAAFFEEISVINNAQQQMLDEVVCRQIDLLGVRSVGLLGLSYNDCAPYVTNSPSIALIQSLRAKGVRVFAYDTRAIRSALLEAGDLFTPVSSASACVQSSRIVVLLNRDPAYVRAITSYQGDNEKVVVDCWRALDPQALAPNVRVIKFGFSEHCASSHLT